MPKLAKLKEHLHGKIIGFQDNNLRFGDVIEALAVPAQKKAPLTEGNVPLYLYLCQRDWTAPATGYVALPVPATPPSNNDWFSAPYPTSPNSIPTSTALMSFLLNNQGANTSHITNVATIDSDLDPEDIPDWLSGLTFYTQTYTYTETDPVLVYDGKGNIIGATWTGSSWMYFQGSPAHPIPYPSTDPEAHPSPYPDLRLDQFTAGALPASGYDAIHSFTLSWETMTYYFDIRTGTENGELVHRLTRRKA
jgi:hypothetical protein